jgi:hypothetical protein
MVKEIRKAPTTSLKEEEGEPMVMGQRIATTMLNFLNYHFRLSTEVCTNLRGIVHYM